MDDDLRTKLQRHEELVADRQREEPRWRELARILRPEDQEFAPGERRDRQGVDTFDSTPLYALDDFVGALFGEGVNPAERWFELEIAQGGNPELMKYGPVKDWLWQVASIVQGSLMPQVSDFYTEVPSWFADMAAFGTGAFYQEEKIGEGLVDRAIALGRVYLARNSSGRIDTVHHDMPMKGRQVKQEWGKADNGKLLSDVRDDADMTVLHCVYPRADYDDRRAGPRGMRYASTFFSREIRDWRVDGGYQELPYHFVEWDKRAGRTYARGPGHNALPDMSMLDEMQYSVLKGAQFDASPIWLTANDDIMTSADIEPDAVIAGAISQQGKELARIAQRETRLQFPIALTEATRQQIRRAFRFSLWAIAGRPQMTAAEFTGWKEEELKAAAPHLVRVQAGLATYITRRYRLLERARRIPPAPPELGGQPVQIGFVSPFAKAQAIGRARGAIQLGAAVMQLQQLAPDAGDNLATDELVRVIHDGLSSDPSLIRDPRLVAQIRQARAEQQARDVQLQRAAQGADIMAEVAHAQQASTLAAGRKPRAA